MARPKRIADTSIRTVLPPGRYSDGPGGNGLSLLVKETKTPGLLSKTWSVRLRINGKYTNRGLGSYAKVTLAEARRKALAYQQAVQEDRDPAAAGPPIFRKVVADYIEYRSPIWREGSRSRQDWENSFENHVFPHIGNKPIDNITHQDLFEVFASIWVSKHPTAQDLVNRISAVMKWAIGNGFIDSDPTPKTVSYLPKIKHSAKHHKALPHGQVGDAIRIVEASGAYPRAVNALKFLTLTAARSGEVRKATWDQIDLLEAVWTIPDHNTKGEQSHLVPLSKQAKQILKETAQLTKKLTGNLTGLVFPSPREKVMHSGSLLKLLRDNGIDATVHGMRSSFMDWAAEHKVRFAVADYALAHGIDDAYLRTRLFNDRIPVMQQWGDYLAI